MSLTSAVVKESTSGDSGVRTEKRTVPLKFKHWKFAFKRALKSFSSDRCMDLAASLTYYTILSLFPALIALISLLGLAGQGEEGVEEMLNTSGQIIPPSALETLRGPLETLSSSSAVGWGLVLGLALALWGASGYVGAFGRALNQIYKVPEGRPFWQLRPSQLLITLSLVSLIVVTLIGIAVSGPVARYAATLLGFSGPQLGVWSILKWPIIMGVIMLAITLLYWGTPNIKSLRFKWLGAGALLAFCSWGIASAGFGFYVAHFGNYDKTYGTLAGVVIFLLWIWITNLALLFGAELNAELLRTRQLLDGKESEDQLVLVLRNSRGTEKKLKKEKEALQEASALRLEANGSPPDKTSKNGNK